MKLQIFSFAKITPSKKHMFFQVKEGELLGVFPTLLKWMWYGGKPQNIQYTGNIFPSAISWIARVYLNVFSPLMQFNFTSTFGV